MFHGPRRLSWTQSRIRIVVLYSRSGRGERRLRRRTRREKRYWHQTASLPSSTASSVCLCWSFFINVFNIHLNYSEEPSSNMPTTLCALSDSRQDIRRASLYQRTNNIFFLYFSARLNAVVRVSRSSFQLPNFSLFTVIVVLRQFPYQKPESVFENASLLLWIYACP